MLRAMVSMVTVDWLAERLLAERLLAERLQDAGTVVLDATMPPVGVSPPVDTRARYLEKHIPGAVFLDIEQFSDQASGLPHTLLSAEEFSRKIGALGVGHGMTIVVYEQEGVYSAPRARWMLKAFGAENVYLLDGGLKTWVDAGLPVEGGDVSRTATEFRATLRADAVKDFAQIQEMIAGGGQILDARSAGRFTGALPEPRPGLSSGHMPGSTSVPFLELVEDGRLISEEKLRALFASKGVKLDEPITTSCGSGVTAAVVALGLEIADAKDVSIYDGSWAEYASRPNAVIAKDE
jgi:thiosulfate/3-mercaptopyruvate sulfurtransferase